MRNAVGGGGFLFVKGLKQGYSVNVQKNKMAYEVIMAYHLGYVNRTVSTL